MENRTEVREYVTYRNLIKYAKECVKFIRKGTARNIRGFTGIVIPWEELAAKVENDNRDFIVENNRGLMLPRYWQALVQAHATDLMMRASEEIKRG